MGNNVFDFAAGEQQEGIDSIGVLYGYGDADELTTAGTTYIRMRMIYRN